MPCLPLSGEQMQVGFGNCFSLGAEKEACLSLKAARALVDVFCSHFHKEGINPCQAGMHAVTLKLIGI